MDYIGTTFFNSMGITFLGDGGVNEVSRIYGGYQSITSGMEMCYLGGGSPHYSVDRLSGTTAGQLFSCEGDFGRMFLQDNGNNKIITSSLVIGAIANGDSLNLKPYIISEIVNRFINYNPSVSVEEHEISKNEHAGNFPDPFSTQTTIPFTVSGKGRVQIEVFNSSGTFVKKLVNQEMSAGEYFVIWDGTNQLGNPVQSGVYYYQIRVNNLVTSDKMLLVK